MSRITFLGTGSAFPSDSYNACHAIFSPALTWLTDAGGGNGIFPLLESAGISLRELEHMFVSHVHTDHLFGGVWIARRVVQLGLEGKRQGVLLNIYGNAEVIHAMREICRLTLLPSYFDALPQFVNFVEVSDGSVLEIGETRIEFFDVGSENVCQSGFSMRLPEGGRLVCLGDEALTDANLSHADGADWLVCGAFCRYTDRDIFRPYEKHHWTVRDVARRAQKAGVRNLILCHCEDRNLAERQELYRQETAAEFTGQAYVPRDGESIELENR